MSLDQIRTILLEQHAALRVEIERARHGAELWAQGQVSRGELQECLAQLADELRAHNACEEKLLRDVIPTIDAWGGARADVMTQVHLDEHRNLCAGLIVAAISDDAQNGCASIFLLLDAMLDHMKQEEKIFLAPDVLTDDIGVSDYFGG